MINTDTASAFLEGRWEGSGVLLTIESDGDMGRSTVPSPDFGEYYYISNGTMFYTDERDTRSVKAMDITIISQNTIVIYSYESYLEYTLYRY